MNYKKIISFSAFLFFFFTQWSVIIAQDGTLDTTFNSNDIGFGLGKAADDEILNITIQPDGKIIIVGWFTTYNGISKKYFTRINPDGTLDESFNLGGSIYGPNVKTVVQPDGKIFILASFIPTDSTYIIHFARINSDGSFDNSFNPEIGPNNYSINNVYIQGDGKIIVTGIIFNSPNLYFITRLNIDGSRDSTFYPEYGIVDGPIYAIGIQNDGKIIIGGNFLTYDSIPSRRIARLNSDGTYDNSFTSGTGCDNNIMDIKIQPDDKIFISGIFLEYNGNSRIKMARLSPDGIIDDNFTTGIEVNASIFLSDVQPDEKIIICGYFTLVDNKPRNRIARLNADGSLDEFFNSPIIGDNVWINSIAIQNDNKIIIGGHFSNIDDYSQNNIARLNQNGNIDSTFNKQTGTNNFIKTSAIQNDGKIIIGGAFNTYYGKFKNHITRLNPDGSDDNSFNIGSGTDGNVNTLAIQSDGKILLGGSFTKYNEISANKILRIKPNGDIDYSFNSGTGTNNDILSIVEQNDSKIIIGGAFTTYNDTITNYLTRLNACGTLDKTFYPNIEADGSIYVIKIQPDQKIIIGGEFTSILGTSRNHIARLNFDGTLDTTFNPGSGANNPVYSAEILPDGKIIIAGNFTYYRGKYVGRLIRINADGTYDNTFNPPTSINKQINTTTLLSDGKIIIGGNFYGATTNKHIARLNSFGTIDTSFKSGLGTSGNVYTISLQNDGKIIIGGDFISYNNIGRNNIARINNSISEGVDYLESSDYSVLLYPNPTTNLINIKIDGNSNIHNFFIYNIYGEITYRGTVNTDNFFINMDLQPSGLYFIKFNDLNKIYKFIKL